MRLTFLLFLVLSAVACGGEKDDSEGNGGSTTPPPLRGGERLSWDQRATSVVMLRVQTYRLYVDNDAANIADVRCNETLTSSGGYVCSGLLPGMTAGRHTLELASVLNGVESSRSAPMTVQVGSTTITTMTANTEDATSDESTGQLVKTACAVGTSTRPCLDVRVVATDLESPSALSPVSDGRLLFIENSRRVRVISNGTLLPEPALELPPTATRLVGLAVDHQFDQTHSVFVSWTEESGPDLTSRLNITRYRELQNSLAQGATIVSGLPLPAQAIAPLAVDRDGLLYVALPEAVLRFTRDGLAPSSNPTSSPLLAHTRVQPGALAVDFSSHVLIAGRDADQLVLDGFGPGALAPWLGRWAAPSIEGVPQSLSSDLAMSLATNPDDAEVLLAMGGRLFKGRSSTDGVATDLEQLHLRSGELAFAAAAAPDGHWYVVTGRQDKPQQLRLIRTN